MDKKICTRCLLREFDKDAYMKNLHDYIENIEEEAKADNRIYEQRLSLCKKCDYLIEGMCRACGCYVELRAAIKNNSCPYEKW